MLSAQIFIQSSTLPPLRVAPALVGRLQDFNIALLRRAMAASVRLRHQIASQGRRNVGASLTSIIALFSRSSASTILLRGGLRPPRASRARPRPPLRRALATNFGLPSLASTRAMSASAFGHFLVQPRALGGEVDHALERQRRDLAAHDELHRALRRRIGEARCRRRRASRLMNSAQRSARASRLGATRRPAPAGSAPAGTFISARTERIAVTRSITQPISASASASSRPSSCGHGGERQQRRRAAAPSRP